MRILIADDEVDIGRIFKTILHNHIPNSQVDVVVNGAEAENNIRNGNYDVVLLDGNLPDKDGYDVCLEIQEICKQRNSKMPFVIFCTGNDASEEILKLLVDKSNYAYLPKPVKSEQLIAAIENIPE